MQRLLMPLKCQKCKKQYWEVGYWRDSDFCLECSMKIRQEEKKRKEKLAQQAAAIAEKYHLDLDQYSEYLPEELRKELNPRNAGRKEVKWDSGYCALLIERAAEGKTESEFAAEIGISQALVNYWTVNHPNFKQARETANELREAWLERSFREAMLGKIDCVPSLLLRYTAVKLGWGDKSDTTPKGGGEIPVVKLVLAGKDFPAETLQPTAEQIAEEQAEAE